MRLCISLSLSIISIICLFVCWLLSIPATCECISGTDLLRQFYVLPHWDRSCRSNFPSHPVTVYWHWADQSQHWPYKARRLAGQPLECQFWSHWYDSTPEISRRKRDSNLGSFTLKADTLTTRPTRRLYNMYRRINAHTHTHTHTHTLIHTHTHTHNHTQTFTGMFWQQRMLKKRSAVQRILVWSDIL